jgi:uncharacterized Zn finger protein/DNA-binding transcriptional regulator YiaG
LSRDSYGWPRYIPVAERRLKAKKKAEKLLKKGMVLHPVEIEGRKIARTFWGCGWCDHLESFSDFANRLPRGRSYVRNGSVCHLQISEGTIDAIVIGNHPYNVQISIAELSDHKWLQIKKQCAGQIGSMIELLQGKLSKSIMSIVTDRSSGLFPLPGEIKFNCDCPDWADMCKHVAAALYGAGRRLDEEPELLFILRGVNVEELIAAGAVDQMTAGDGDRKSGRSCRVASVNLEDVFGIDLSGSGSAGVTESQPGLKSTPEPLSQKIMPDLVTGATIAGLRSDLGMTQAQFARLIGVSISTINNWEKNKGALKLQTRTRKALTEAIRE